MERKRANRFGSAIFFIGLAVLLVTDWWWPGIAVVIASAMALPSLLQGRFFHALTTGVIATTVVALTLIKSDHLWTYLGAAALLLLGLTDLTRATASKSAS
jgi:hypothetical protein